jgi:membrane-associated protease RseP (regulator of RpoE activity)
VKDPLGDDAPPVETRKAIVGISVMILAIVALVIVRPSTAVTVAIIVGLVFTIMLHEFGHYIAAKKSGMKVTEFFLGFGPRIWSFRRGETEYGIKAIPAGGYVRIIGMTNLEEVDPEDEPRTYRQATTGKRLITVLAGIIVNLIIAVVLVFGILVFHGDVPPTPSRTIGAVQADSPAAKAGLRAGDEIVAVDGQRLGDWEKLGPIVRRHDGEAVRVAFRRDGKLQSVQAVPRKSQGVVRIGVISQLQSPPVSLVAAVPKSFTGTAKIFSETVGGLGKVFSVSGLDKYGKTLTNSKGGLTETERPRTVIGIVAQGDEITGGQWWIIVYLLATINVFLAFLNALPIPPLDGGHAAVALYEGVMSRARGRRVRVDYQKVLPVAAVAVTVILVFGLSALYLDLRSL